MSKFLTNTSAKCVFLPLGKRVREVLSLENILLSTSPCELHDLLGISSRQTELLHGMAGMRGLCE